MVQKHPLALCSDCPYNDRAHKFVPTKGGNGEVAFVGLAPGKYEARQGEPFVGASGKLVNILLESQNLNRDDITLTNAVACHPPKNEEPPKAAIAACRPRLLAELEGHDTVLAMGNVAAQSLLQTRTGITKLRVGPGRESDLLPGTKIIPTIHPAACLRNADAFPNLLHDVEKLTHEPPVWIEPKYRVASSVNEALRMIAAVDARMQELGVDEIVVDIETDFDKDVVVDHADNITLVGIAWEPNKCIEFPDTVLSHSVWHRLTWLFKKYKLIAQNGKFDFVTVWQATGVRFSLFGDTMLAHYTLDERGGIHDLEQMAVELLGSPLWKHRQDEEPYLYNAYDCANEFGLWQLLKQKMEEQGTRALHDFIVAASNAFMRMEYEKIRVDLAYNDQIEQELRDALLDMIESFPEHDGGGKSINDHINPNSAPQVQRWFESKGFRVLTTDKEFLGQVREDARFQERLGKALGNERLEEINDFIDKLLAYRKESKLLGTYVVGARKRLKHGMLQPTYTLHNTTSGRPSCRNPNLQNIPIGSKIKKQFIPTVPGNVFVHVDYAQAEMRLLAWFSRDEALRYMFEETERDPFDELTVRIYGQLQPHDTFQYKEERVKTKTFAYGTAYGLEYKGVAKRFHMTMQDAKREHSMFLDAIPGVVAWQAATRQAVLDGEDLVTPFGRHRRFWLITNENKVDILNEALAFKPQSTASDICVSAFVELEKNPDMHLRNIIHDAILAECRPDEVDDVTKEMQTVMQAAAVPVVGDYVTFKTDATSGPTWGHV